MPIANHARMRAAALAGSWRTFSSRLRASRAASDVTQQELADTLSCSVQAVANWERGRAYPTAVKLVQIACMLQVSVDWLLTGERLPNRFTGVHKPVHAPTEPTGTTG